MVNDLAYYKVILNRIIYRSKNQHRQSIYFQYLRKLNSKLQRNAERHNAKEVKALILKTFIYTRQLMTLTFFMPYSLVIIGLLSSLYVEVSKLVETDVTGNVALEKELQGYHETRTVRDFNIEDLDIPMML